MTIARPTNDRIPCAAQSASGAVQYAHVAVKKGRRPNGADAPPAPIPTTITEQRPDHIRTRDLAPFFGPGSWPARVRATVRARHAPAATRKLARTPARAKSLAQTSSHRVCVVLGPADAWFGLRIFRALPRSSAKADHAPLRCRSTPKTRLTDARDLDIALGNVF